MIKIWCKLILGLLTYAAMVGAPMLLGVHLMQYHPLSLFPALIILGITVHFMDKPYAAFFKSLSQDIEKLKRSKKVKKASREVLKRHTKLFKKLAEND